MEEIRERNSISVPESDRLTAGSIRVSRKRQNSNFFIARRIWRGGFGVGPTPMCVAGQPVGCQSFSFPYIYPIDKIQFDYI